MAVTTEPPWTNKASGVAARNAATTHVSGTSSGFSFGFTPTSGRLLVLFVSGAVTHTASTGWTKRQGPVSSAEVSMFERTADGGANDVITITHNASDYPMAWTIYEFPAGSVHTASNNNATSANTFTALTGLPGTAQVILAAFGAANGSTSGAQTGSVVWGGSMIEDQDTDTVRAATDGCYLTVAHIINITATSYTPTLTVTGGAAWPADREKIVAAYNVAVASTPAAVAVVQDLSVAVKRAGFH